MNKLPQPNQHAINYETAVKNRLASEPDTYKKFLDILHTYRKEQRGIKEVIDEVSILFKDHPDLLKDFINIVPDALQKDAKVRLELVVRTVENQKKAIEAKNKLEMDQM